MAFAYHLSVTAPRRPAGDSGVPAGRFIWSTPMHTAGMTGPRRPQSGHPALGVPLRARHALRAEAAITLPIWQRSCQWLTLLLLAGLTAAGARADAIPLSDGKVLTGHVRQFDGVRATLDLDNGVTTRLPADRLAPSYRYQLVMRFRPPSTGAAHLALARFCLGHRLIAHAGKHLDQATRLDPSLATQVGLRRAELDEMAAEVGYRDVLRHARAGRFDAALKAIDALSRRYPATAPAGWARDLTPSLRAARARQNAARRPTRPKPNPGLSQEVRRERQRQALERRARELDQGARGAWAAALEDEGMGRESVAIKHLETSSDRFEQAYRALDQLRRALADKPRLLRVQRWRQSLVRAWAVTALAAAHIRARQANWKDAIRWCELAIRLEPLAQEARRLHKNVSKKTIRYSAAERSNVKPIVRSR